MAEAKIIPVLVHGPNCFTTADDAIEQVKVLKPRDVCIIGYDEKGEWFFRTNISDGGAAMWLLQMAAHKLLKCGGA